MKISVRISGGVATGKTTLLHKIEMLIAESYELFDKQQYKSRDEKGVPEEHLFLEFGVIPDANPR